ncbi:hypothetical protein LCGC14_1601620 [marine sediment metagenome]|uniref:Uncharacterized protein n=1 Tax=marine sediment metagenome TaxID=412755 RepID=A0A0F9KRM4_9ZZZZ
MIPPMKQEQIVALLETELSIKEVAARTQVSRNTITTIKKRLGVKRCPGCGAAVHVVPCIECRSEKIPIKKKRTRKIELTGLMEAYIAEAPEFFRIVEDLRSLHKLGLIKHRLFLDLGERAKNSFNRIFPPIEGRNATKKKITE